METISRTCRWVCHRLPLLVGGELAGAERREVERHLIGCLVCQGRRDASQETLSVLRDVAALGPVHGGFEVGGDQSSVWPALARQIRESRHRPERFSIWDRAWSLGLWNAQIVVGSGLVAAGLILGLVWMNWSGGRFSPVGVARPTVHLGALDSSKTGTTAPPHVVATASVLDGSNEVYQTLDDFEVPVARPDRRSSALPQGEGSRGLAALRPGSNPFQPPLSLRLDYDLDWGTLSAPVSQDAQRSY